MTTIDTLTDSQIEALRTEAGEHGDESMVAACTAALDGSDDGRAAVVKAIRNAEAQGE